MESVLLSAMRLLCKPRLGDYCDESNGKGALPPRCRGLSNARTASKLLRLLLMKTLALTAAMALASLSAFAAIQTETIEYKDGDTTLEGFLAYDDSVTGPRPGVLVV